MTNQPVDPIELTRELIRCPTVTPQEGGALTLLQSRLEPAGFQCFRIERGQVSNLFARWGKRGANKCFGFNGHTDVVPVGDETAWTVDPFGAVLKDGFIWGRGATDMKSAVAAFAAAAIDFVNESPPGGSVVLTITGDEEAEAVDGTVAILDWMAKNRERMSDCLVGEPTCPNEMGETIKNGRRGSLTAFFTATGIQGHSAYPHRANNPVPVVAELVNRLVKQELDQGTDYFDPSTLQVTSIDTGNRASNVIPAVCRAIVNIRFNDAHSSESLIRWMRELSEGLADETGVSISMETKVSGESFVTAAGPLTDLVKGAIQEELGRTPGLSTSGGTSDARFIKDHCPVVEFGLVGRTMHEIDERVAVEQIVQLKSVYGRILRDYFK